MENAIIIQSFPDALLATFGMLITVLVYAWPFLMAGLFAYMVIDGAKED